MAPGLFKAQLWVIGLVAMVMTGGTIVHLAAWAAAVLLPLLMLWTLPRVIAGLVGRRK